LSSKVRTAVVGLGIQGPTHALWSYSIPESQLTAVCDVVEEKAKRVGEQYHVKWYTDYDEMLENKDIDAVIIVTPQGLHAELAIKAAKAGKHVAVEKPMCLNLKQADEMRGAVKRAGVLDAYFENLCFAPAYATAKEIVDAGGIGDVFFMRCGESDGLGVDKMKEKVAERVKESFAAAKSGKPSGIPKDPLKEYGGGMLLSGGVHAIAYCRHVYNKAPAAKVYAEIRNLATPDPRFEDTALLTIRYKDGKIAWVDCCEYALGTFDDRAEIYGSKGTIFLDLYRQTGIQIYSQKGYGFIGSSNFPAGPGYFGVQTNWSYPIPDEKRSLGYYNEQQAFFRSIIKGERPIVNFDDGRATIEIVMAAYKSRDTGNAVSLPLPD